MPRRRPKVPHTVGRIRKAMEHHVNGIKDEEKTPQDWKRQAIVSGIVCDLAKPLYIGREKEKLFFLHGLLKAFLAVGGELQIRELAKG